MVTQDIYARRGELVVLMFADGLTEAEKQELQGIDRKLDELEQQLSGANLDRLEAVVVAAEKLAESINNFVESDRP